MATPPANLPRWAIYGSLALLGTALRLALALKIQPWSQAPDWWAWATLLHSSPPPLQFDQLLHYPHEGGSILLSLLALGLAPSNATALPALIAAALVLDFGLRWWASLWVEKLLGPTAALAYALWQVCALPLLLWWGILPVGLHYLASFFPLLFVCAAQRPTRRAGWLGVVCGLGVLWTWDNLLLLGAALPWLVDPKRLRASVIQLSICYGCALALVVPFLLIKLWLPIGFELEQANALWLRGVVWVVPPPLALAKQLIATLFITLPNAIGLSFPLNWLWWALWLACLAQTSTAPAWAVLKNIGWVVGLYLFVYSLSPFHTAFARVDFSAYRHLAYILPLVALAGVGGGGPRFAVAHRVAFGGLLALSLAGAISMFTLPAAPPNYQAAGWVLARKLGHDPQRLEHLIEQQPLAQQAEWMRGVGWGTTATLLNPATPLAAEERLPQLQQILNAYAPIHRPALLQGVCHAFAPGITPQLDATLLTELQTVLDLPAGACVRP